MNNIQQYLESYRKRLFAAEDDRSMIIETIFLTSGVSLNEKDITVKKHTIHIQSDSATKNELFLYRGKILDALKGKTKEIIVEIS